MNREFLGPNPLQNRSYKLNDWLKKLSFFEIVKKTFKLFSKKNKLKIFHEKTSKTEKWKNRKKTSKFMFFVKNLIEKTTFLK